MNEQQVGEKRDHSDSGVEESGNSDDIWEKMEAVNDKKKRKIVKKKKTWLLLLRIWEGMVLEYGILTSYCRSQKTKNRKQATQKCRIPNASNEI